MSVSPLKMPEMSKPYLPACLSVSVLIGWLMIAPAVSAAKNPYDWAFIHLDDARQEKVDQLRNFCDRTLALARQVGQDPVMQESFEINLKYVQAARTDPPPAPMVRTIEQFRQAFSDHYIRHWLAFYDILFIDKQGTIFNSIRNEADCGVNLFDASQADAPLAQCLKRHPQTETFVDFHNYCVSDEPAGFIVVPIHKDGVHLGWIALQLAINKINTLFADTDRMGETGEAILVNRQGYMLTESNFDSDETILKTRLDDANIEPKFSERRGNRRVTDYRGFRALTSFEVVEFMGVQWLVVVKVDEAEITTEHFRQHPGYYNEQIVRYLQDSPVQGRQGCQADRTQRMVRQVDMDEFIKVRHDEVLQTVGVSTCTALIAAYPGKFGYLAHISPLDRVYGGDATDLTASMAAKIKTYDVCPYERRWVRFIVIARHLDSLTAIVRKLVDEGFLLSQISVMYQPQARHARVFYDYSQDHLCVEWILPQPTASAWVQHEEASHNLGGIVRGCVVSTEDCPLKNNENPS